MDTIHQSGMGRGGSTLPPDQLSRISPMPKDGSGKTNACEIIYELFIIPLAYFEPTAGYSQECRRINFRILNSNNL